MPDEFEAGLAAFETIMEQMKRLRERAERAEALLYRLKTWDVLWDSAEDGDGAYWTREINKVLDAIP